MIIHRARVCSPLLVGALSILALSSCSDKESEIPQSICGVTVEENVVAPLLKADGKVSEWRTADWGGKGTGVCRVSVDDKEAIRVRVSWHEDAIDLMQYSSPDNSITGLWEATRLSGLADDATLGDDGAMATARCHGPSAEYLTVAFRVRHDGQVVHQRDEIKKFARSFVPGMIKEFGCKNTG
ncbi:hypothetical protein OKJ48_36405 [Streptomyces kunmingensis]|uniref:DUF3558 domain-containing protein n=1 Tax=Streptomyces kunmingensis TaxID=68225 RepID=A0ABU6CLQ0_9ACTN|nr:hypothetical protein [Streptomyces kunmingensis]MEB3965665.1 hypothetical protein [Streptomyces kunmingensis]